MNETLHDIHAERASLGGAMLNKDAALDVAEVLRPGDFYQPRHEIIFESIVRLLGNGNPVDVIAVVDDLVRRGELARAGGADYVHGLTDAVPSPAQAAFYADLVRDKAVRRHVMDATASLAQLAPTASASELIETARRKIEEAAGVQRHQLVFVGDLIEEVVAEAERPQVRYATPWSQLDDIIGGFRPGALYVVGARPGIGKSALALQMAGALTRYGPVGFSSLEMPTKELVRRVIAQNVQMPHSLLERGSPMPELWKQKISGWAAGSEAPHQIAIDDRATVTITDIRAFGRAVQRPSGRIAGLVIDYLQLMGGTPGTSRYDVITENARQCKIMARELGCPVILLSQLNRDPEKRIDKRPTLADLKESGAIEQDADVVFLIYRDPTFEQQNPSAVPVPVPLELNVAKNRHGPTMMTTLSWEGTQMRAY